MEADLRGSSLDTIKSYVEALGGVEQPDGSLLGEGWTVRMVASVHRFRQWEFPRVLLTFEGDPDRIAVVMRRLRVMAMRGGA